MKDLALVELPNFNDPEAAALAWLKEYNAKNKALAELASLKRKKKFNEKIFVKNQSSGLKEKIVALVEKNNGISLGIICNRMRGYKKQDIERAISDLIDKDVFYVEMNRKKQDNREFFLVFAKSNMSQIDSDKLTTNT